MHSGGTTNVRPVTCKMIAFAFLAVAAVATSAIVSGSFEAEECSGRHFEVVNDEFGGLHLKVLRNVETGELVSVIYDFGGRIEDIHLLSKQTGELKPVIWSHHRNATSVRENGSWRGQILLPYANRVFRGIYDFRNVFYRLPIADFAGHHAMHGLIFNRTFTVIYQGVDLHGAVVVLEYNFNGDDLGYPFLLRVRFTYRLLWDGFFFSVNVTNMMDGYPMPFQVGWHPYFLVSDVSKAIVSFDRATAWNHVDVTPDLIPTGMTQLWDNFTRGTPIGGTFENPTAYDDGSKPVLPIQSITTTVLDPLTMDQTILVQNGYSFPFVHVFTGSASIWGVQSVAVEPMSGMADCFNNKNDMIVLDSSQSWEGNFEVKLA